MVDRTPPLKLTYYPQKNEVKPSQLNMSNQTESPLASFAFPRTGKRGVPQQFPRRLYEMLDSETKLLANIPSHPRVIAWSDTGNAFRIYDVHEFAASILPKYFRTKKFSSFQRNLNLYGFNKVRRGPEADFYTHPNFLQNSPESLLKLRKLGTASRRRVEESTSAVTTTTKGSWGSRPISPSPPNSDASDAGSPVRITPVFKCQLSGLPLQPLPTESTPIRTVSIPGDRGRLDLLALALESQAFTQST